MINPGRNNVAPSKAFLYKQQALRGPAEQKNYLNFNNKSAVNSSVSKLDRNGNAVPSTVQNYSKPSRAVGSPQNRRGFEEGKRANSVASGDTIISTASSSSPIKKSL
jgi:hypothetical protein